MKTSPNKTCVCVFAVMLHGPAFSKVKREPSPSTDLSPCRTPHADMCLYSYRYQTYICYEILPIDCKGLDAQRLLVISCLLPSACDKKPALTSAPTSAVPCGPPPLQRQLQPPAPRLRGNCATSHVPSPRASQHQSLPPVNQNQQFALPQPPTGAFSAEQK